MKEVSNKLNKIKGVGKQRKGRGEDRDRVVEKVKIWRNKGLDLIKLKRYEKAIKYFDKAIAINPNDEDAWHDKGVALGNLARNEEAMERLGRIKEFFLLD